MSLIEKLKRKGARDKSPKPPPSAANLEPGPSDHSSNAVSSRGSEAIPSECQMVERYGISVVTEPEEGACDVDVVCVHGLMGHPYDTWLSKTDAFFWPAHVMNEIPNARVMTFGYDADPKSFLGQVSQNRLGDHARNLLQDLARERTKPAVKHRPILFVAHSLGGLVVKKALSDAEHYSDASKHLKAVAADTRGVVFLGTPHAGSGLTTLPEIASRVLRGVHVNQDLLRTLKMDSEMLGETTIAFGQLLERRKERKQPMYIQPFVEELPIPIIGVVVPAASASMVGYLSETIHADHMAMTKFASRRDQNYKKVISTVDRWLGEMEGCPTSQSDPLDMEACLKSLHFPELKRYDDPPKIAHTGTFGWIFDRYLGFREWLCSPEGLYWIQGHPGSGKSTLIGYILRDKRLKNILASAIPVSAAGKEVVVALASHYFQVNDNPPARSIEGMLRSLIWNLAQQMPPDTVRLLVQRFESIAKTASDFWTRRELKAALTEMIEHCPRENTAIALFIDGLDEHDGKDVEIADYIRELAFELPTNVRICLASRPYPDFNAEFREAKGFKMHERISGDISHYVDDRKGEYAKLEKGEQQAAELSAEIKANARGSFLWVRLACNELRKHWRSYRSFEVLMETLRELPEELGLFYARILNSLDERETREWLSVLSLVMSCHRPLTTQKFIFALDYDRNVSKLRLANQGGWASLTDREFFGEDWLSPRPFGSHSNYSLRNPITFGHIQGRRRDHRAVHRPRRIGHDILPHDTFRYTFEEAQERIELAGRGFLIANRHSVRISHETMHSFVSKLLKASQERIYRRGDELLFTASALCWRARIHRNIMLAPEHSLDPTFLDPRFEYDGVEHSPTLQPLHKPTVPLHVFQEYLVVGGLFGLDLQVADAMAHHARELEVSFYISGEYDIPALFASSLGLWLETEVRYSRNRLPGPAKTHVLQLGISANQSSPQSMLLEFLIYTGCDAAASLVDHSALARNSQSNSRETIDVNQSEGYLLLLAADRDHATLMKSLAHAGAKIGKELPLASSAIHHAILCGHTHFGENFLRLLQDGSIEITITNKSQNALCIDPRVLALHDMQRPFYWESIEQLGYSKVAKDRIDPLSLACSGGKVDMIDMLLELYPEWEDLLGSRTSALVAAAFSGHMNALRQILNHLQSGIDANCRADDQGRPSRNEQEHEDRYFALLAAVDQGHGELVDELLQAGIPPQDPGDHKKRIRIPVGPGDLSLTPLHLAISVSWKTDRTASKQIVQSLAMSGARLFAQVQDVLPKITDLGILHAEDHDWIMALFPDYELGPPDLVRGFEEEAQSSLNPEYFYDGFDSEEADGLSVFGSSQGSDEQDDGSSDDFLSAKESLSEAEDAAGDR